MLCLSIRCTEDMFEEKLFKDIELMISELKKWVTQIIKTKLKVVIFPVANFRK